jgi:hypothetical protein
MPEISEINREKLKAKKNEVFELTHLGATARLSMKYLRSAFRRNRVAELTSLKNIPVDEIKKILKKNFNINVNIKRIKTIPPVDPGEGIDHGYIKTLGKYKHGNRVIIKYIYRIQEGFFFNFFFEAFYRITILSEEEILLDIQKNFDAEISPTWQYVMNLPKKIADEFENDMSKINE